MALGRNCTLSVFGGPALIYPQREALFRHRAPAGSRRLAKAARGGPQHSRFPGPGVQDRKVRVGLPLSFCARVLRLANFFANGLEDFPNRQLTAGIREKSWNGAAGSTVNAIGDSSGIGARRFE